jgi:hypothetical protein
MKKILWRIIDCIINFIYPVFGNHTPNNEFDISRYEIENELQRKNQ